MAEIPPHAFDAMTMRQPFSLQRHGDVAEYSTDADDTPDTE